MMQHCSPSKFGITRDLYVSNLPWRYRKAHRMQLVSLLVSADIAERNLRWNTLEVCGSHAGIEVVIDERDWRRRRSFWTVGLFTLETAFEANWSIDEWETMLVVLGYKATIDAMYEARNDALAH